jgi:hypothetical protein
MLKKTVDRYQHGSVRKVKRAQGFAWEFRYYVMEGSKRKPKVQTFDSAIYKTEKALRQHLESFVVKLNEKTEYARSAGVTFGALLDRYIAEEMPQRKSTKGGYLSIINSKLRPQWGSLLLSEIRPAQVHTWLQHLDLAPVTKGHIKSLMHKLFDLATLWEYLPLERRNPIEIVKVKNVTMRTNEVIVLSAEQFREIAPKLPEHVNMIAMAAACLGLRVSEILGLQWSDIDWEKQTVPYSPQPCCSVVCSYGRPHRQGPHSTQSVTGGRTNSTRLHTRCPESGSRPHQRTTFRGEHQSLGYVFLCRTRRTH